MLEFRIGERAEFQAQGRPLETGVITRYNRKTVTVITDAGHGWNVAPKFLRRPAGPEPQPAAEPEPLRLPRR